MHGKASPPAHATSAVAPAIPLPPHSRLSNKKESRNHCRIRWAINSSSSAGAACCSGCTARCAASARADRTPSSGVGERHTSHSGRLSAPRAGGSPASVRVRASRAPCAHSKRLGGIAAAAARSRTRTRRGGASRWAGRRSHLSRWADKRAPTWGDACRYYSRCNPCSFWTWAVASVVAMVVAWVLAVWALVAALRLSPNLPRHCCARSNENSFGLSTPRASLSHAIRILTPINVFTPINVVFRIPHPISPLCPHSHFPYMPHSQSCHMPHSHFQHMTTAHFRPFTRRHCISLVSPRRAQRRDARGRR